MCDGVFCVAALPGLRHCGNTDGNACLWCLCIWGADDPIQVKHTLAVFCLFAISYL